MLHAAFFHSALLQVARPGTAVERTHLREQQLLEAEPPPSCHTVPRGIPCWVGYRAVEDTVPPTKPLLTCTLHGMDCVLHVARCSAAVLSLRWLNNRGMTRSTRCVRRGMLQHCAAMETSRPTNGADRRTAVDAFLAGRQMHIVQRAQQRRELKPLPPLLAYVVGIVPCRIFTLRLFVCLRLLQHAALH